jgi:hypothetical protein
MKTRKQFIGMAIIAIIAIAIIGCKQDEPTPTLQIQREYNDLTLVRGKSITLIDETGSATDLKARGIWQKLNEAFGNLDSIMSTTAKEKFDRIYTAGGKITIKVVGSGADYTVDGHNIKLSLSFVNNAPTPADLGPAIAGLIYTMVE